MSKPFVILSGAIASRSEEIAQSKDPGEACGATGLAGRSSGAVSVARQGAQGECLSAAVSLSASSGSFDSVSASLRSARTPLRMTGLGVALFGVLALSACRQDMHDQPRFKPLAKSDFYADQRSERPPVEDTVARGQLHDDTYFYTGKIGTNPGDYMPFQITEKDLSRGRERYNIYCAPCHSRIGDGNGMIVQRGFKPPPSYHIERLRKAPLGYFFDVMTNGFGSMPDYASQIPAQDRWRIVAYIRALQLSQNASQSDVASGEKIPSEAPHFKEPGSGASLPVVETKQAEGTETAGHER